MNMGSCPIIGSAYHKNTNAKVESANSVVSFMLRAYINGRKDDWDVHLLPAKFAINNAASTFGDGLTTFFIDRGAHPRLPLSQPHDDSAAGESPAQYARRMQEIEATVLELLAETEADHKAKLDAGRVDTVCGRPCTVADQGATTLASWDCPVTVTACPIPNTYTLACPRNLATPPLSSRLSYLSMRLPLPPLTGRHALSSSTTPSKPG